MVVVVVIRLRFSVVIVVFVGCIGGSVAGVRVVFVDVGRWG